MLRQLRWQIVLAIGGIVIIGIVLSLLSNRRFEDRPARGGELVEAVVGRPAVLNPLFASSDAEGDIASLLFCSLTRPDPQSHARGDLATRWTVSPDGLTYTFRLREGATWHDGQPVTAADVVFTAEMAARIARDSALAVSAATAVRPWERVTAESEGSDTVILRLSEPYAPFLDATMLGLLPKHLLDGVAARDLPNHRFSRLEPIGCGPYRLDLPGGLDSESARLVRYEGHWAATSRKPYLDAIQFRFFPTIEAAVDALGQRSVQAMGGVPAEALADLGEDARIYAAVQPGMGLVYLNNATVLFGEQAVREALGTAVNRERIASASELLNGQAQMAANPIPVGSWAYEPNADDTTHDPTAAGAVLDAQGWADGDGDGVRDRDGKPLRFRLGAGTDAISIAVAEALRADWAAIGVEVVVESLDQPAMVRALSARDYEAMLFSWELPHYDPDPYPLWHSSQARSGQNYAVFADEQADRFMVEARRMPPSPDNLAARAELYRGFQEVFAALQPSLVLYHRVYNYVVVDPNVGGVQLPQLVVQPSDRFFTLPEWFARTDRVFGQSEEDL